MASVEGRETNALGQGVRGIRRIEPASVLIDTAHLQVRLVRKLSVLITHLASGLEA